MCVFGQDAADPVDARATEDALQNAIARRDRLRSELSLLIASARSDQVRHGLLANHLASAAEQIRRLEHDLQSAKASVASLELERAEAIVGFVPTWYWLFPFLPEGHAVIPSKNVVIEFDGVDCSVYRLSLSDTVSLVHGGLNDLA
jgi:hypothetical protein